MAQVLPRYCPRCGAPFIINADVCAKCGLPLDAMLSREKHNTADRISHSPELLPEIEREATLHDLEQQQANQSDKVPTQQLDRPGISRAGTQPLAAKNEPTNS